MKISYEDHDTTSVITVSGEMTGDHAQTFRRVCEERLQVGIKSVVLDLEYVTLIDSLGLEVLLWLIEAASEGGGHVRLVRVDPTVRKIMEITRLERRFSMYDTIESAAKSLHAL